MSILLPVFAQASTVCTETMINGRAVQRCVTGTKPYTAPTQPPAINTPLIPINPPSAPLPPPPSNRS